MQYEGVLFFSVTAAVALRLEQGTRQFRLLWHSHIYFEGNMILGDVRSQGDVTGVGHHKSMVAAI
jgi:hypothetical protein